jgi:putative restriction endonuclease
MTERRSWTRDELLVALKVYCELEFGKLDQRNKRIIEVSDYLNRTPSSLAMKLVNFASLDPAMHGKGLKGASKADRAIMEEFMNNMETTILQSEEIYTVFKRGKNSITTSENEHPHYFEEHNFTQTEKLSEVKIRTVQKFFRNAVISSYHSKCAVCNLGFKEMLVASHIIPWSQRQDCRANPANGISLCGLHDKAFDRGFFTIGRDYTVILSEKLISSNDLPVEHMFKRFENQQLTLPFRFAPSEEYLKWHRNNIFIG